MQKCRIPFFITLYLKGAPQGPPWGPGNHPKPEEKKHKVLEFHFSRGHFYTKILNYVILFPSYLKGAPEDPPGAQRIAQSKRVQNTKFLGFNFS